MIKQTCIGCCNENLRKGNDYLLNAVLHFQSKIALLYITLPLTQAL
jgi:hypothetical protein